MRKLRFTGDDKIILSGRYDEPEMRKGCAGGGVPVGDGSGVRGMGITEARGKDGLWECAKLGMRKIEGGLKAVGSRKQRRTLPHEAGVHRGVGEVIWGLTAES